MAQPEALLSQKIIRSVEAAFPFAMIEKQFGTVFGTMKLDLRGSVDGYAVEIEVKLPGEKPVPRQFSRIRYLKKMKVITGWCTSVEEALEIIRNGLEERREQKA